MNFPFLVARRYLFSKKSANAINVITGISILGMGVGTAALVLVLSVFNGFEDLLFSLMNSINADIKVSAVEGKTFFIDSVPVKDIALIEGVESVSLSLEETVLIEYEDNQDFCTLKGVELNYNETSTLDSALIEGRFLLQDDKYEYLIVGAGIANRLNIDLENPFESISVYMPKRSLRSPVEKPFKTLFAYPSARFSIKQDYDYQYAFSSLDFIQELTSLRGYASAIEIKLHSFSDEKRVLKEISNLAGSKFVVKDRYEQNESLFKLMMIEKWISFAILCLTLLIVSFNLIGSLWMIVLDKRKDISILKSLGATKESVRQIFLQEGLLICALGISLGFFIALVFYGLQKGFGIVPIPDGFVVDAYPIGIRIRDFIVVGLTVLAIGFLASYLPSRRASRITAYVREE
jgi:lipoprotein-releasing system permease protein